MKFTVNCETKIKFKIDAGADVSYMEFQQARSLVLKIDPTLTKRNGGVSVKVLGKSSAHKEDIYIIHGLKRAFFRKRRHISI